MRAVIFQVVTAEVHCKALSTLITYVLERGRPDPSANATTTVVAIAKLENYLRKNVFGAFSRDHPFSAHNLLESTVQRWVDGDRRDLLEQVRQHTLFMHPYLNVVYLFAVESAACKTLLMSADAVVFFFA